MNNKDEKLLREFVRRTIVNPAIELLREEKRRENSVRLWVRSQIREFQIQEACTVIYEAKDMANPHPNTGINMLRATLRKAKPSIKSKFQQLTTSLEQRESFRNHFLAAFVRLFQQLDALSASGEAEDVEADVDLNVGSDGGEEALQEPDDSDIDDITKELDSLLESLNLTEQEEEESERKQQGKLASSKFKELMQTVNSANSDTTAEETADTIRRAKDNFDDDTDSVVKIYKDLGFTQDGMSILAQSLESGQDPETWAFSNDVVTKDLEAEKEASKDLSQVEKDVEKKKSQERDREEFGGGLEGDSTGRNQAYDCFNLVQSYFSDAYLDLNNDEDKTMFKKWCLYNLKLLLDSYEEELNPAGSEPEIENPQ